MSRDEISEPARGAGQPISRVGTARALVLLASGLSLAASAVACFVALVFGPALLDRDITGSMIVAVAAFVVITLVAIALANLFALRAASTRGVVLGGCATLLAGTVLGIATLLLLITSG